MNYMNQFIRQLKNSIIRQQFYMHALIIKSDFRNLSTIKCMWWLNRILQSLTQNLISSKNEFIPVITNWNKMRSIPDFLISFLKKRKITYYLTSFVTYLRVPYQNTALIPSWNKFTAEDRLWFTCSIAQQSDNQGRKVFSVKLADLRWILSNL